MAEVFIALGSNLNNPQDHANCALAELAKLPDTTVSAVSPFYRSKPLGPQDQNDYLNAVIKLTTSLAPIDLLDHLQAIELLQGRIRKSERWGARTLDLDILLYDNLTISNKRLTIPHYDMKNREFVLYPLFDIAPDLILPDGITLKSLLTQVSINGMRLWQ
ncbi:2-amino-4-hydroxy-6-hydroxymethyldihydropteridine diphosphokinase [Orbaceae bacterium ESL0721]|nr:2-amino-4-hydroxy-6-hydroxymethyldihydropteridine diphosphokinase [Orbaceae bacterium ESL0721]